MLRLRDRKKSASASSSDDDRNAMLWLSDRKKSASDDAPANPETIDDNLLFFIKQPNKTNKNKQTKNHEEFISSEIPQCSVVAGRWMVSYGRKMEKLKLLLLIIQSENQINAVILASL